MTLAVAKEVTICCAQGWTSAVRSGRCTVVWRVGGLRRPHDLRNQGTSA